MKIFYLITKSTVGGVQTHIYQLSRHFAREGNIVAVMSCPGGWLEKAVKEMGVKFYPNVYLANTVNIFKLFKAMKEIKKAIRDFEPDLVSCHSTVAGVLGRMAIRKRIPTVFTAHGWGFSPGVPFWRKYLILLAEKIVSRFSHKIICVSYFDKSLALKHKIAPEGKLEVIHNGVELQNLDFKEKAIKYPLKIVFVGRLGRQKDPILLLRAFNNLSPELKNKTLVSIIGDGPKRKKLENFIKENKLEDRVVLTGDLKREKIFEIFRNSDIFVLTSNWEGFPRSILEAMSFGLAVIATNVGGVKEAISSGDYGQDYNQDYGQDCGILIRKGSKKELENALEKLLKNPQLIQKMGEKARERVRDNFSLEEMFEKTEKVYKEILPF